MVHGPERKTTGLTFEDALAAMREGKRVRLGPVVYVLRDSRIYFALPWLEGEHLERTFQFAVLLAEDWEIVEETDE